MTRNTAVTVRVPGARMAPTSRTLAHSHTCSRKTSSKCRRTVIMAGGRSRMVQSFLVIGSESSVPCLSHFVYQMDKVELRTHLIMGLPDSFGHTGANDMVIGR